MPPRHGKQGCSATPTQIKCQLQGVPPCTPTFVQNNEKKAKEMHSSKRIHADECITNWKISLILYNCSKFFTACQPCRKFKIFTLTNIIKKKGKSSTICLSYICKFYFPNAASVTLRKRAVISFGRVTAEPMTTAYGFAAQTFSSCPTSQIPPSAITLALTVSTSV